MTTILEAPSHADLEVRAMRASGSRLRLAFNLDQPRHVVLKLSCPHSGWTWSEDMGLVLPGDEIAEVGLSGWPSEPTLLEAWCWDQSLAGVKRWAGWVTPGSEGAVIPYLCS